MWFWKRYSNVSKQTQRYSLCLYWNQEIAELARQHNNANALALPARFINKNNAVQIVEAFCKLILKEEGTRKE